jgi:hypothetical protein
LSKSQSTGPSLGTRPTPLSSFRPAQSSCPANTDPAQRNQHLQTIKERDRLGWQCAVGYGRHSLGAVAMPRYISSQVYSDGQVAGDPAMTVENLINAIKAGVLVNGRHIVDVSFSGRSGGGVPR